MEVRDAIMARRSVKQYDPDFTIDDDTLRRLFEMVVLTPSSFNLQHWTFVVVREPGRKKALREVALNQAHVEQASAVIVVCGKLNAHEDAAHIYATGPADVQQQLVPLIHGFYAGKPQPQREEAIRSCMLATMTLMLAAQDMGLATGPLIGFDPEGVRQEIGLPENYFPALLVVLGKQTGDTGARRYRRPLADVVHLERFDGPGLGD